MSTIPKPDDLHHHRLFEEGLKVRREVLGDEYVCGALGNASSFSRPGQELITEFAWGTVWRRPGLDRKQRSLLSKCNFYKEKRKKKGQKASLCDNQDISSTISQSFNYLSYPE